MTLDTEPTTRLPVVDVPSAVITTEHHIARARANSARRARIQRRWDLLARILSYLLFGGTIGLLIGICGALFALALSLADQDGAVPAPESTTTASLTTLPSMPSTAYPLLGGITAAATAPPTTTRPRPTPTPARPASTTTPAPVTTGTTQPPATATSTTGAPSTTAAPTTTTPPPTDPPSTPAPTDTTTPTTDPSTTATEPATPPST